MAAACAMTAAALLGTVHFGFQRCQLLADVVIGFQFGKRVIQSVLFTDTDAFSFRFHVVDPAFELLETRQGFIQLATVELTAHFARRGGRLVAQRQCVLARPGFG